MMVLFFFNEFLSDTLKRIGYIFVKSIDYIKKIATPNHLAVGSFSHSHQIHYCNQRSIRGNESKPTLVLSVFKLLYTVCKSATLISFCNQCDQDSPLLDSRNSTHLLYAA